MPAEQNVEARPRKWLFPVILVVLLRERSYGYEIMERLARDFGFEHISPGSVYRSLRQMEKEGLCDSEWEPTAAADGGGRRTYYITDYGESYLAALVEAQKGYVRLMDALSRIYASRRPSGS